MTRVVEALVQAGWVETRYVRAGRGLPVLLLSRAGLLRTRESRLFRALAREFRVVAPALAPDGEYGVGGVTHPMDTRIWLRDVIEGLGMERPGLVAAASLAPMLASFLETEGERIACAAFVHGLDGDDDDAAQPLAGMPEGLEGPRLLVLRMPEDRPAVEDPVAPTELVHFLAGVARTT